MIHPGKLFCADKNKTMKFAAEDLRDFFNCHTQNELQIINKVGAGKNIVLILDVALAEGKGESYCLKITQQQIIVSGTDAGGVMYGVFRSRK